ncbi:MAG: cytochrome P460 family protein [Myxococcales bacterium]|nr:cytochrome P460 family protein [Myxococcales bacterium]
MGHTETSAGGARPSGWTLVVGALLLTACTDGLPADVAGYAERCVKLNAERIPLTHDDPHTGEKNVYACNVLESQLFDGDGAPIRPYPDGTLIVKEAFRDGQAYPWLVALMRKGGGAWQWAEYTRNFADQDFAELPISESVCTDCHRQVEPSDWVFTPFTNR